MKRSVTFRVLFALTLGVLIAGCASAARTSVKAAGLSTVSSTLNYTQEGVTIAPPPVGASAAVGSAVALATCKTQAPCINSSDPEVVLGLFSDKTYGAVVAADGAVISGPAFMNILSWVLIWHNVGCMEMGPPQNHGPGLPPHDTGCDQLVAVNANTGAYMVGITGAPAT